MIPLFPAFAEDLGTTVSVDGISIKELKGVTFTIACREVKTEDEGPLKVDGKLITEGSVGLLDRVLKSESKVEIIITNVRSEEEAEELKFNGSRIESVSKGAKKYVYRFTAEAVE